ncbi:hypothetical protein [Streptomyces alkaliterrae]|uniref:Uncharacterized protein n=1 Tax=Streptomyces alkaliterrae TaxID=2213162 RepID=A0A7W3WNB0_9ACTN|nr:hypothetical protein [Streptomyces alkaliterrae]MBB1255503.1 hypothetical protein [Streptomyces alkaliterrae]MBB1259713.1 hypothetical protein [Streptomyces alkaliterrae]
MTSASSALFLAQLAQGGEHGGQHASLNPLVIGLVALGVLLLMLFVTTSFNRDR